MGVVIQLFGDKPPKPEAEEAWSFGRDFIDSGLLNLEALVEEMQQAETEEQLFGLLRELKDAVAEWPDL